MQSIEASQSEGYERINETSGWMQFKDQNDDSACKVLNK